MQNKRIYYILIAAIVSLIILNQVVINYNINQQLKDGTIINFAGRQRMLSQKITKNTLKILAKFESSETSAERTDLRNVTLDWKNSHNVLVKGDTLDFPTKKSTELQQLYTEIKPSFDVMVSNAEALVMEKDAEKIRLHGNAILRNESTYLAKMENIVTYYEQSNINKIKDIKRLGYWLNILLIGLLIGVFYYVVNPVFQRIYGDYQKYFQLSNDLKNKNREIDVIKSNVESKNRLLQRKNEILAVKIQELEDAKQEALMAVTTKSEFLSNMSHEIRTPLNAIIGVANILTEDNPRDDQSEHLDTLIFSAENLMVIINDILDYSKIEAGKVKLEEINFNIRRIIKGIHKTLIPSSEKKGIEMDYLVHEDVPNIVIGDPVRISQILLNLASNAVKFTEQGKVDIQVRLKKIENEKAYLHFSVTDTGIGIAEHKQQMIFDSFSQANSKTTRLYGGTGLGLAITKQLLELQGSHIQLDSIVGEGSTFYFELILPVGKFDKKDKNAAGKKKVLRFTDTKRVLLVDDNAINVVIAKRFLNKWNLEVDVAYNGQEAVDKVKETDYGLVLMDISMPIMDGYEATRIIRSWSEAKFHNLPIVALTASVFDALKYQAIEAGMDDYLSKPFKPQELYDMIERYILAKKN